MRFLQISTSKEISVEKQEIVLKVQNFYVALLVQDGTVFDLAAK